MKNITITPLITLQSGRAHFIHKPTFMEPGYNRSDEACTLDAMDDWETIIEFLNEFKASPKTLRSYTSELERFISWLLYEKKLPVSAIKRSHVASYMDFLKAPDPQIWCGYRANKFKKDGSINKDWFPFSYSKDNKCGLADATVRRSRKILDSYFKYLVDNNYLYGNPLTSRRTKGQRKKKTKHSVERYFEVNQIIFILETLQAYENTLPIEDKKALFKIQRARYLFLLYLHTGMRISEPADYTMGDLENNDGKWTLFVQGKGDEVDEGREIQLGQEFMEALKDFRLSVGLSALPLFDEKIPLVPQENLKQCISERQISNIFRWLFDFVAQHQSIINEEFDKKSEEYAQLIREVSIYKNATCHWLRHSHATFFLKVTDDLQSTKERLGHADVSTTMLYLHTLNEKKKNQANKFSLSEMQKS